ncbi:MAG: alpha-glucosidase [Aerococcus sp.]|nr:alpha-glucosidase [Aerococcus sp.]
MTTKWWQEAVVYQVYPQSFKDSNGDGVGDLNGLKEKLPYLKKLGVDVLWLNPIFQSPLVDNGYDISDYYQLNPQYGTLADFKTLLKAVHDAGMRLILDLVVNHTSDQHAWFQESKKNQTNPYADYYIWKDPKPDGSQPNNWGSTFGGPAWTYVPERQQYYLHCFAPEQPDLNWENPEVRQSIYQMMRYWFDLGVDGFRMDVISLISKRPDFPDASEDYAYTKRYYAGASNGPRVHEFLHEMYEEVLKDYDVMTVGETPNTNSTQAQLYTFPEREELNMVFHFDHMHLDYGKYGKFSTVRFKLSDLKRVLTEWQNQLDQGWNSLYWSNHDQPRAVTRFGDEGQYRIASAKMLGTLLHMMKGTPYIFEGEELGMKNVPFEHLDDYQDIETKYFYQTMQEAGEDERDIRQMIYLKSRDNARTPMPWDGSEMSGFSTAKPWLPYSPDNQTINVEDALKDPDSVFYHYQHLIQLRKHYSIIVHGTYRLIAPEDSVVYAYVREYQNQTLLVICSFSEQPVNFTIPDTYQDQTATLLSTNYPEREAKLAPEITLAPYEARVYLLDE